MNLSKTEKLLAAKKKLKEFQLNKMKQDASTKHQLNLSEPVVQQTTEMQKSESEVIPEQISHASESFLPYSKENSTVSPTTNLNVTNGKENTKSEEVGVVNEEINATSKAELSLETENFPMAQKEHILEMASAVADVLTNDSERSESTLDCDFVSRDQFLNSYLEDQKNVINDLHIEIAVYRSRISELENKLETRESEFLDQLARETDPLREQLQIHARTTGILIAEKAELTAALAQTQQCARQSTEEIEDLSGKLKTSQIRMTEMEKEIASVKSANEELRKHSNQLQSNYDSLEESFLTCRKEKEDISLEASELRQKLNLKKTELVATQQDLQEKIALLSLSELRIQQMKDGSQTEDDKHSAMLLEQKLAQTKETLKLVNEEKDEANKQYQNYVKELDAHQGKLLEEVKAQKKTIDEFQSRESSYIQRLSELEQQLQQERAKLENPQVLQDRKEQMDNLLRNIDELTLEQERLHIALSNKDTQIEALTNEVRELREAANRDAEVSKLVTALESEQLGASRAVHQNRQLKEQLTDMENAFVSLSNAKLDLTEQLQAERSIGRKLNAQLYNVETELGELRETLKEKDTTIMELEKEKLQSAQIADQMQHYQAQSHHADTYQRELQNALLSIEKLEKEKKDLLMKIKENSEKNPDEIDSLPTNENHSLEEEKNEVLNQPNEEDSVITVENFKKLEDRFKETMERVAELTEEKQKLEHLVLQLQSETETIGEYIALYQKQRAVLHGRARERDQVFRQLLEQRNQQQEQLHKLKVLVSDFLLKEHAQLNGKTPSTAEDGDTDEVIIAKRKKEETDTQLETESVSELLDLLTEIKDCKDTCVFDANFHPCPWCSGKLITV